MPSHITPEFLVSCHDCEFFALEFSAGAAEACAERHIEQVVTSNGSAFQPHLDHYVGIDTRTVVTHCDSDSDEDDNIERILFKERPN